MGCNLNLLYEPLESIAQYVEDVERGQAYPHEKNYGIPEESYRLSRAAYPLPIFRQRIVWVRKRFAKGYRFVRQSYYLEVRPKAWGIVVNGKGHMQKQYEMHDTRV